MKKKVIKKKRFAIGIFLLLTIILSTLTVSGTYIYFTTVGKQRIQDIELYSKGYSKTLAEALSGVAELSYRSHRYRSLRNIFRKKIDQKLVDEAFFVKSNGKIVVHSDRSVEKRLKGNIANDEFYYNMDFILMPVSKKSKKLMFFDYNISGKKNIFNREERKYLKKYLYNDINKMAWLITKGVFVKRKPVGVVSFIISKNRIFNFIKFHIDESIKILKFGILLSVLISLFVSIVVVLRYRGIQKKDMEISLDLASDRSEYDNLFIEDQDEEEVDVTKVKNNESGKVVVSEREVLSDDEMVTIEYLGSIDDKNSKYDDRVEVKELTEMNVVDIQSKKKREIKDAIPIKQRVS